MTRLVQLVERLFNAPFDAAELGADERPCENSMRIDLELADREDARAGARRDVFGFASRW